MWNHGAGCALSFWLLSHNFPSFLLHAQLWIPFRSEHGSGGVLFPIREEDGISLSILWDHFSEMWKLSRLPPPTWFLGYLPWEALFSLRVIPVQHSGSCCLRAWGQWGLNWQEQCLSARFWVFQFPHVLTGTLSAVFGASLQSFSRWRQERGKMHLQLFMQKSSLNKL